MYFERDFKWDSGSNQFKEWCNRSQGFIARSRGITHATIATLESQLQASIDLARNLVRPFHLLGIPLNNIPRKCQFLNFDRSALF